MVKRKTSKKRFSRAIKTMGDWLRKNRHSRLPEQHKALRQKLIGHLDYYGITGNFKAIASYAHWVRALWRKWLHKEIPKGGAQLGSHGPGAGTIPAPSATDEEAEAPSTRSYLSDLRSRMP